MGPIKWAPYWEVVLTHDHCDGRSRGEFGRPYFLNRHVRPEVSFDWRSPVTRESLGMDDNPLGCHVSGASTPAGTGDDPKKDIFAPFWSEETLREGQLYREDDGKTAHQRDWDILSEAVAKAYAKAGVNDSSDPGDRIRALVDLQNAHKAKVYPSRHPVDTLLHSSYCTGAANLLAALCMIAGFPARTLNNAIHSMSEVWDGRRWLFVDNLTDGQLVELAPASGGKAEAIFNHNYIEMLAGMGACADGSPMNPAHASRYADEQPFFEPFINTATKDWRFNHGRMGITPSLSPMAGGVGLFTLPAPDNVRAIYPEWDEPLLFSRNGCEAELSLTPRQGWLETIMRLDRRLGIKKSFFVGALDDGENPVRSARADLHLSDSIGSEFSPTRGGWVLLLNGEPLSLDPGVVTHYAGLLSFALPVDRLMENTINTLELFSEKAYQTLQRYRMPDTLAVRAYPDALGTELPWYASDEAHRYLNRWELPEGNTTVTEVHSGWLLVPDGI